MSISSGRDAALAGLRRQMAVMSGRPDTPAVALADRSSDAIPVPEPLSEMLPHKGLARGTVTRLSGVNSVLIAVIATVTQNGGQVGIVGLPRLGLLSAAQMGADLSRIATVPSPGTDPVEVAAVLLDGMDLVVLGTRGVDVAPSRSRAVAGASATAGGCSAVVWLPRRATQPRVSTRSLIVVGTPSISPHGSPFSQRLSDARAAASAPSSSTRQKAWTVSFQRRMRSRQACATSTGDSVRLW